MKTAILLCVVIFSLSACVQQPTQTEVDVTNVIPPIAIQHEIGSTVPFEICKSTTSPSYNTNDCVLYRTANDALDATRCDDISDASIRVKCVQHIEVNKIIGYTGSQNIADCQTISDPELKQGCISILQIMRNREDITDATSFAINNADPAKCNQFKGESRSVCIDQTVQNLVLSDKMTLGQGFASCALQNAPDPTESCRRLLVIKVAMERNSTDACDVFTNSTTMWECKAAALRFGVSGPAKLSEVLTHITISPDEEEEE